MLPTVAKVFESLVHTQLSSYIENHYAKILHCNRSGFKPHHSTQDVLLKVVDDWCLNVDRNEIVGVVFLDLHKAFDSINHTLLLEKLYLWNSRK